MKPGRIKTMIDPRVKVELQRIAAELDVPLDDVLMCALGVWFGCEQNYRLFREIVARPEWPTLSGVFAVEREPE